MTNPESRALAIENIKNDLEARQNDLVEAYDLMANNQELTAEQENLVQRQAAFDMFVDLETASLEEAGANHVLEAMASGLPVLYRAGGGSINEYCKDYGIEYDSKESMIDGLIRITKEKNSFKKYKNKIENTIEEYEAVICKI